MGIEYQQANNIKDGILLWQDHLYQVIQVLAQLQMSLDLTNEDQKTLGELKDCFIDIFHKLAHLYYTSGLGTDCINSTNYVLTKQYCNTPERLKLDMPKEVSGG